MHRLCETYLGIFALRKLLVLALELYSNLIPLLLPTVLHECLNYTASIVLEHNVGDFASHDAHQGIDMLCALCL